MEASDTIVSIYFFNLSSYFIYYKGWLPGFEILVLKVLSILFFYCAIFKLFYFSRHLNTMRRWTSMTPAEWSDRIHCHQHENVPQRPGHSFTGTRGINGPKQVGHVTTQNTRGRLGRPSPGHHEGGSISVVPWPILCIFQTLPRQKYLKKTSYVHWAFISWQTLHVHSSGRNRLWASPEGRWSRLQSWVG